jgi:GNAT superfamily N-acetyltransferase
MSFRIDTYSRNHIESMTARYNAETAFEPHIAPLDPERFIALVEAKAAFDPAGLLLAVEDGRVVGWVHACVAAGSEPGHDPREMVPRLRMLIFPADRMKIGNALVTEATAWLQHTPAARGGVRKLEALHAEAGYPFYRGLWLGGEPMGPATMPHVQVALEVGGYKNTLESVFMTAEMSTPPPDTRAASPVEFIESVAEWAHEAMQESWTGFQPMRIQALVNGEEAGSIGWVVVPHVAARLGAPVMNIWSLGVRDRFRRQGIASALVARAMTLGHAAGARFGSLGTQLWNAPAHATYARFGFRPHCVLVGRQLVLRPED